MSLSHLDSAAAELALTSVVPLIGAGDFPREQALLVLARGHVAYANGDLRTAQVLARTAGRILNRAKLPRVAAEVDTFVALCRRRLDNGHGQFAIL